MIQSTKRVAGILCLSLLFQVPFSVDPTFLFAKGRQPKQENYTQSDLAYDWVQNGITKKLKATQVNGKTYFSVGKLARLSGAQLRWQSVTHQACLSRVDGLLCFNWDRSTIYHNGTPTKKKYSLLYHDKQLYIPMTFVPSKTFESFTKTNIALNDKKEILTQDSPVTLRLPPVENFGDRYRISVEMEDKTSYQVIEQSHKRVWLRFVRGRFERSEIFEGDKVVREVRVNQKRRSADLIIKLGAQSKGHSLHFDSKDKILFVDVFTKSGATLANVPVAGFGVVSKGKSLTKSKNSKRTKYKPVKDRRIRTVIIDAGHGGKDSGAIGVRGTMEKRINLKVAKALAKELKKQKNLRVIMTRNKDEFLELDERTRIANEARAHLFVSIHCNSSFSSKSRGFEVYILSHEASDEAAAAVARIENSVIHLENGKGKNSSKLNKLLASMAVYEFINESSECAGHICRGVKKKSPVRSTKVREANFHVLRGAQMPGVLIELEYLSNPITEQRLRSSRYRSQMVRGLAKGILDYDTLARQEIRPLTAKGTQAKQEL